ncbi:uncharacterized protein cubi_01515 [Cryptosporidium ubiquitum]|uniref:Uncharacterized protein n=1 Tax=Cryptosporidium ubiquitum TaxID=857276 RepID=A0A1J4MD87_9CRYT|nr:uncharacterized protein cubi_01515 [Cryptosporidium ubiquitum]OII72182.1 hypothetical protein cubi_01515 [Cryptosporidium ubiquitum]
MKVHFSLLFFAAFIILIQDVKSSDIILNENYLNVSETESILGNLEVIKKEYKEGRNLTNLIQQFQNSNEERFLSNNLVINKTLKSDPWELIEAAMKNTTVTTPAPPFNSSSTGACIKLASDVEIIFGSFRSQFQDAVAKCSRKSLGSHKNTFRCISKLSFNGQKLSDECNDCWAKTAHCGVKHCASQCLFSTCVTKCQRCSTRECSKVLNECAGTVWMPLPCGLSPHDPIPDNFKVSDPK